MEQRDEFYGLIPDQKAARLLSSSRQSYLLCSFDSDALMLLARYLIEQEGGKFTSPDVKILPQTDKLTVADIDFITTDAAITPLELKSKYYILKNGETLSDATSNKLLKTLEEPPSVAKIIILVENEQAVLPTIRSRCQILSLSPFDQNELNRIADRVFAPSALLDKAKSLSFGSINRLIRAANGELEQVEKVAFDTLTGMKTSRNLPKYAEQIVKLKDRLPEIADMLELILADSARLNSGAAPRLDYRTDELKQIAQFYSVDTIIRLAAVFERTRHRLRFYGNAASVVDELLFALLEIRQKCQC